ncbi:MAG: pyridoxamine 5'-phosphate oxidase family protein [Candidatus Berkelbacteria bacterium]|nr:pyridoxamine 5'-phosphate oxidase family protein [Candidatus Berkelbacteria bacterium]
MDWKNAFDKDRELILATCSKSAEPNANIVISLGFVDGKLLIGDYQMHKTIENLKATKLICIISKSDNHYLRAKGSVEVQNEGRYFDICQNADKNYPAKNAILVKIDEVINLENQKKIL